MTPMCPVLHSHCVWRNQSQPLRPHALKPPKNPKTSLLRSSLTGRDAGAQGALRVGALDVVASVCLNSGVLALVPRASHLLAAAVALSERAAADGELDLIAMCAHRACGAACGLRVCDARACALHLICCPRWRFCEIVIEVACLQGRCCRGGKAVYGHAWSCQGTLWLAARLLEIRSLS